MNRQLATLPRIAGAAAAQAAEQHSALGSSPQLQTAQLQSDGYGIGGHGVSAQTDGYGLGGLAASVQTDIQKPGH